MTIIEGIAKLLVLAAFCLVVAIIDGPSRVGPVIDVLLSDGH